MPPDPRHVTWVLLLVAASSGATYLLTSLHSAPAKEPQQSSASVDASKVKVGYINIWGNFTDKVKLFEEIIEPDVNAYAEALPEVARDYYGVTGWVDLDMNGDRVPRRLRDMGVQRNWERVRRFGVYDGAVGAVHWDDALLEEQNLTRPCG
ncbi:hypothetical protein JXL21_06885 [Candidatus Bathyarchaeota archaeon]|nr:hypothetical protein [Candidatus Bathyarchaeota archaeon]